MGTENLVIPQTNTENATGKSNQPVAITENTLANTKEPQPGTNNTWIVGGIVFGIAVILGIVITIYVMQKKKK